MKHTIAYLSVFLTYFGIYSVFLWLDGRGTLLILLTSAGGVIGFILPIVFDALVPKLMKENLSVNKQLARDVLIESAVHLKNANLYDKDVPISPLRSYPLLIAYGIAALFVVTSSANVFGKAVVLGIGLSLMIDLYVSRSPITYLRQRWFSVFRTELTDQQLVYFVWGNLGLFVFFTLITWFS